MTVSRLTYTPSPGGWKPSEVHSVYRSEIPPVGTIVGADHVAWRIADVRPQPEVDWSDEHRAEAATYRQQVPTHVQLERLNPAGPTGHYLLGPQQLARYTWYVLPEHHAVCGSCGRLSPCPENLRGIVAENASERAERDMAVPEGWCPACVEPISDRQRSITYPGPNLLNPLARDGVRFHARQTCLHGATVYERRWVAADARNPRSILTLECEGRLLVHHDGSADCTSDACPHVMAHHRGLMSCYLADEPSCSCPTEDHPGAALAPTTWGPSWPWIPQED